MSIVVPGDTVGGVSSVNGKTGAVVLTAADVSADPAGAAATAQAAAEAASDPAGSAATAQANAEAASDPAGSAATAQANAEAFTTASFAPLASPSFTGTPLAPTAAHGTNTTQLATTAFVLANAGASNGVTGMPGDTLVEIDGLSGSPDRVPASPSSFNDEFDENASGTPTGWTLFTPLLITADTNTALSHLHLKSTAAAGAIWAGIFKTAPTPLPFTVTAKLSDLTAGLSTGQAAALFVGDTTPGAVGKGMLVIQLNVNSGTVTEIFVQHWTDFTTFSSTIVSTVLPPYTVQPLYFRIICTDATHASLEISKGGMVWWPISVGVNPGFTPTAVGLAVQGGGSGTPEAMFDWIRFT